MLTYLHSEAATGLAVAVGDAHDAAPQGKTRFRLSPEFTFFSDAERTLIQTNATS